DAVRRARGSAGPLGSLPLVLKQAGRRNHPVRLLDERFDRAGCELAVEADADPSCRPDIRRYEKHVRIGGDEIALCARRGGTKHRNAAVAVMTVREHREDLSLYARAEGGRAPGDLLVRL